MENELRAHVIEWLQSDPDLSEINAIEEESPLRASAPWLGIAASTSIDWGAKDKPGREVRIALELESRTDDTAADNDLISAIEARILNLPRSHPSFEIAAIRFLRARSEARERNLRGALLEFRIRIFNR